MSQLFIDKFKLRVVSVKIEGEEVFLKEMSARATSDMTSNFDLKNVTSATLSFIVKNTLCKDEGGSLLYTDRDPADDLTLETLGKVVNAYNDAFDKDVSEKN